MRVGYVYSLFIPPSEKYPFGLCYIGMTYNIKRRLSQHKYYVNNLKKESTNPFLYRVIRKCGGWDCIEISYKKCKNPEKIERDLYLKYKKSNTVMLNLSPPDGKGLIELTKEQREARSIRQKEYWNRPENKEKLKQRAILQWGTPEGRQKTRELKIKYYKDPKNREKASLQQKRVHKENPELSIKLALNLAKYQKENKKEFKRIIQEAANRPEVKKKKSIGLKKYFQNPTNKEKHCKIQKEYWNKPENRKKRSDYAKKFWNSPAGREAIEKRDKVRCFKPILQYKLNNPKDDFHPRGGLNRNKQPVIGDFVREWDSHLEASTETGIPYRYIRNNLKGKQNTAGGFVWKYK